MAVYLAVTSDVFDSVLFCAGFLFSHEMSWMRSGTKLRQFLRIFLPSLKGLLLPASSRDKGLSGFCNAKGHLTRKCERQKEIMNL